MKKQLFTDGVSHISVDTVERLLQIEQQMERKQLQRKRARLLLIPAAAIVALLICMTLVIIPYIPRSLDIEYIPSNGLPENVWVYYVNENGAQKREYVNKPQGALNTFAAWKHLNTVGDEVQLLEYVVDVEEDAGTAVVPNNLWEFLVMKLNGSASDGYKTVTATLSPQITSYENYDALIESLRHTLAKYAGVTPEQVRFLIEGEGVEIIPPDGTSGRLQFSHSLQDGSAMVGVGGTLEITVTMTNISLEDIEFTGSWGEFVPGAILTMGNTAVITHEPYDVTQEYQKYTLAPGESREMTYVFPIPEGAVCGEYDLLVTFGDDSFTFEKAVHVVAFGYIYDASTPFAEFLTQYGFDTADTEKFKAAVDNLSYQGTDLFELMAGMDGEWSPLGCRSESWTGDQFDYQYTIDTSQDMQVFYWNYFSATALPDGMTLPHGITPEDTLTQAICKLGYTEEQAKKALQERKDIFLTNASSSVTTLIVNFDSSYLLGKTYTEITYRYGGIGMMLRYDQSTQSFEKLVIEAQSSDSLQITFTSYKSMEFVFSLSEQQLVTLTEMLSRAEIVNGTDDKVCDCTCLINGQDYSYDTTEGMFCGKVLAFILTEQDREAFNDIINGQITGDFDPGTTIKLNSPYDTVEHFLYPAECTQIIAILNSGEWQTGEVVTQPYDCYEIIINDSDGMHELCYDSEAGIFQYDDFYLRISQADMNTVNEIFGGYTVEMPQ